jgi:hypothetical protein
MMIAAIAIGSGCALLGSQWSRLRCAYRAFETARAQLNVETETNDGVSINLRCGKAVEKIWLPALEQMPD